jgi:biotin operon repressor
MRAARERHVRLCDVALVLVAARYKWAKVSTLAAMAGTSEASAHRSIRRLRAVGVYVLDFKERR